MILFRVMLQRCLVVKRIHANVDLISAFGYECSFVSGEGRDPISEFLPLVYELGSIPAAAIRHSDVPKIREVPALH